jgi:hypothetical protein
VKDSQIHSKISNNVEVQKDQPYAKNSDHWAKKEEVTKETMVKKEEKLLHLKANQANHMKSLNQDFKKIHEPMR